ncbi:MAG: hypothetical protein IJ043_00770 [Clostridia bacterium]|nr:hypothetical protein [Clostridia bacterium]
MDVYLDENQNEYRFNKNGTLTGYFKTQYMDEIKGADSLSELKAIQIAKSHALELYGSILNDLPLDSCRYDESLAIYYILFSQKIGADDFITGAFCEIAVYTDGSIAYSNLINTEEFRDFDPACLSNVTLPVIDKYTYLQLNSIFPGNQMADYHIQQISLYKENDCYFLQIGIEVILSEQNDQTHTVGQVIYYELEK